MLPIKNIFLHVLWGKAYIEKINIYFYSMGSLLKVFFFFSFNEQIVSRLLLPAFMGSISALLGIIANIHICPSCGCSIQDRVSADHYHTGGCSVYLGIAMKTNGLC